jgi:3alpha(or 20beta)-hydroxysteroid dehydrogenase
MSDREPHQNRRRFEGKTALVTGASGGIGQAICEKLIAEGAHVYAADIKEQPGTIGIFLGLDVTSEQDWAAAVGHVRAQHTHLDVLVNNAGIYAPRVLADETAESFARLFAINQLGPFLGMKVAAPLMPKGASIVNVSSTAGLIGTPDSIGYGATKWAVLGLTRSAAKSLASRGIRVNTVCPGAIDTPMVHENSDAVLARLESGIPLGHLGSAHDVAEVICFLASSEARYITGTEVVVDGGAVA